MKKNRIFVFIPHYLPGTKFGGPIQSISNITEWLFKDFIFKIVTSDRDFLSNVPYKNIIVNEWNQVGEAEVLYLSPDKISLNYYKKIMSDNEYDLLYLNSLFNPKFTLLTLLVFKFFLKNKETHVLIAPRGELSKGALEQKRLKKMLYLKFLKYSGLKKGIYFQATDSVEKNDIIRELDIKEENIYLVSNLPIKVEGDTRGSSSKRKNHLKIIYLSRITSKKNISYILNILGEIHDLDIELHMYGTVDDNKYWAQCLKIINSLPSNIKVLRKGHLEHSEVVDVMSHYDLFVLPTKGENYGHAIVEAISAGTPVLISTNTPWRNLEEKEVGWDIKLENKEEFKEKIRSLARISAVEMNGIKKIVKERSVLVTGNNSVSETKEMMFDIISNA